MPQYEVVAHSATQDFHERVVLVSDNGHHREIELPSVGEMYTWLDQRVEGFADFYEQESCDEQGRMILFAVVELLDPPTDRETKDVDMGLEYHVRNQWASKLWQQSPYSCGLPKVGRNTLVPAESVIAFTYFLAQSNPEGRTDVYHLRGYRAASVEQVNVDSSELDQMQAALEEALRLNESLNAELATLKGGETYVQLQTALDKNRQLTEFLAIANRRANTAVQEAAGLKEANAQLRTQNDKLISSFRESEKMIQALRHTNANLIESEAGFSFAILVASWAHGLSVTDSNFLSSYLVAQTPQALADQLHIPLSQVEARIGRIFGSYNTFVVRLRTERENKRMREMQDEEGMKTKKKKAE